MDLAEICRVMGRRWYVLLPGLLLTAALVVGVYVAVPITYQSQSTVMLLNSQKATVVFDGNPFLSTQTSLTGMADSLARNLNSDASIADLKAQGATGTSVAKIADNALGPLMWLTVSGTDQAAVLKSDKLLTSYAQTRLEQFQVQQTVKSAAMIRMTTIVPPQNPVAQTKTRLEYLVMAGLLGVVGSMVGTFYVEARLRKPTGRRAVGRGRPEASAVGGGDEQGGGVPDPAEAPAAEPAAEEEPAPEEPEPVVRTPARPAPRWSARDEEEDPAEATETDAHRFV